MDEVALLKDWEKGLRSCLLNMNGKSHPPSLPGSALLIKMGREEGSPEEEWLV